MSELQKLVDKWIVGFQQNYLDENLKKLTPDQQAFYHRIYPNGPTKDQIYNAADQIERTLKKNGTVPWPQCTW